MGNMDINLDQFSSIAGWQRLAEIGMSFGTNLLAALAEKAQQPGQTAGGRAARDADFARQNRCGGGA